MDQIVCTQMLSASFAPAGVPASGDAGWSIFLTCFAYTHQICDHTITRNLSYNEYVSESRTPIMSIEYTGK